MLFAFQRTTESEVRPSFSKGVNTPFPKEAPEVKLGSERPSGSFTSGGFLPKEGRPPEGRASSRRKGVLPKEGRPPEGRASSRRTRASRRTCVLPKEGKKLLPSGTSGAFRRKPESGDRRLRKASQRRTSTKMVTPPSAVL